MGLTAIDEVLFQWINLGWDSPVLDFILIPFRNKYFWIPVYVFIISFLLFNFRKRGYYLIVFLLLCVGTADFVSNRVFKHTIQRPRPCHVLQNPEINLKVRCGSGYSFTSNHAANHFAIATFLLLAIGKQRFKSIKVGLLFWATLVAVAQVYVGVHYPVDIICGGILGYLIARFWFFIWLKVYKNWLPG